jgi:hypothetical protein
LVIGGWVGRRADRQTGAASLSDSVGTGLSSSVRAGAGGADGSVHVKLPTDLASRGTH